MVRFRRLSGTQDQGEAAACRSVASRAGETVVETGSEYYPRAMDTLERFDQWVRTATRYVVLANTGGVAATLGFIGPAMGQSVCWKLAIIPLASFVAGIFVGSLAILGQLTAVWVTWIQEDVPASQPEQTSFVTRVGMWAEGRTGRIMFASFACFAVGALTGLLALALA